jgi:hypothetical protein
MNQYFFKMSQAEKNNILDQHKTIYDGYVTQFGQASNTQPLYVQDFANDKGGIVVTNKGNVKNYTNFGINESHLPLDMIGDGPDDLENGTVDFGDIDSSNDDYEFLSTGRSDEDEMDDEEDFMKDYEDGWEGNPYDYMEYGGFDDEMDNEEFEMYEEEEDNDFDSELSLDVIKDIPDDLKENFIRNVGESLSMFKRIIN